MKAIEAWLDQGDPATLRKLTVFAEYDDDGKPLVWRACCMAGSTNGLVAYAKAPTVPDALAKLDKLLASQGASVLGSYEDPDADEPKTRGPVMHEHTLRDFDAAVAAEEAEGGT